MAIGFGRLRLSPKTFWAMTPRELERAISVLPRHASDPPRRDDLAALMRAYPDPEESEASLGRRHANRQI